jgi:hypothetical protein
MKQKREKENVDEKRRIIEPATEKFLEDIKHKYQVECRYLNWLFWLNPMFTRSQVTFSFASILTHLNQ